MLVVATHSNQLHLGWPCNWPSMLTSHGGIHRTCLQAPNREEAQCHQQQHGPLTIGPIFQRQGPQSFSDSTITLPLHHQWWCQCHNQPSTSLSFHSSLWINFGCYWNHYSRWQTTFAVLGASKVDTGRVEAPTHHHHGDYSRGHPHLRHGVLKVVNTILIPIAIDPRVDIGAPCLNTSSSTMLYARMLPYPQLVQRLCKYITKSTPSLVPPTCHHRP